MVSSSRISSRCCRFTVVLLIFLLALANILTAFDGSVTADEGGNLPTSITSSNVKKLVEEKKIIEFERQEGVVIATKIHGPHQLLLLDQSLCLLHYAYNKRPLYDIVVFTTTPVNETEMATTRRLVAPAKLTFVLDNRGLQNEIAALTTERREKFLKSCNVTSPESLHWWSNCPGRIAYNWQAEFRSWHIWKHPALADYTHMMWLDADGFPTKVWEQDPVTYAIEQDLVILFNNFPQGNGRGIQDRVFKAFNTTLCKVKLNKTDGRLETKTSPDCWTAGIPLIHGFFHITNLDFYRSDPVMYWAETLIGDCFLCRKYDDQVAVTVPAAILAPNRSRGMRESGIYLGVFHNSLVENKRVGQPNYVKYWKSTVQYNLTEAVGVCPITAGD